MFNVYDIDIIVRRAFTLKVAASLLFQIQSKLLAVGVVTLQRMTQNFTWDEEV